MIARAKALLKSCYKGKLDAALEPAVEQPPQPGIQAMPEISTLPGLPFLISAAFVVKMVQGTLFGDDKVLEVKMNPFLGQEDYLVYKRFEQAFLGAASAQPKLAKITAADLEKSTGFQYHKLSDWILLLYHGTPSTNISSILESGFATVAARSKNRYWFSGDPFVCTSYADEDTSEYYLLAVLVLYPEKMGDDGTYAVTKEFQSHILPVATVRIQRATANNTGVIQAPLSKTYLELVRILQSRSPVK